MYYLSKKNWYFVFPKRLVKDAFILEKTLIMKICLSILHFKLTMNDCFYLYYVFMVQGFCTDGKPEFVVEKTVKKKF